MTPRFGTHHRGNGASPCRIDRVMRRFYVRPERSDKIGRRAGAKHLVVDFGDDLLLLELVKATTAKADPDTVDLTRA